MFYLLVCHFDYWLQEYRIRFFHILFHTTNYLTIKVYLLIIEGQQYGASKQEIYEDRTQNVLLVLTSSIFFPLQYE